MNTSNNSRRTNYYFNSIPLFVVFFRPRFHSWWWLTEGLLCFSIGSPLYVWICIIMLCSLHFNKFLLHRRRPIDSGRSCSGKSRPTNSSFNCRHHKPLFDTNLFGSAATTQQNGRLFLQHRHAAACSIPFSPRSQKSIHHEAEL